MTALVRAELLKLRTVALPAWLLLTALLLVVLSVLVTVLTAGQPGAPAERESAELLAVATAGAAGGNIVVLVLGVLMLTQEFRFGTATPSFLVTPRRGRVLAAKVAAAALAGLGFALVSAVVALGLSATLIAVRGDALVWDRTVVEVLLGVAMVMVLYGPLGVAVGALVRNQIAAVVGVLAWNLIAEQLLVALLPRVGQWTPGGAVAAVLQLGEVATVVDGDLLPVWGGAALLLAYTVAFSAAAARLTLRRDLT